MDQKELYKKLNEWVKELQQKDREELLKHLANLKSVFPFNVFEYRLMFLLDKDTISFDDYELLREKYVDSNPYLHLYRLSPRVFGEIWAQKHIAGLNERFEKPSKVTDKSYTGDYDLCFKLNKKIIKIEIKASRAINTKLRGGIEETALNFKSKEPFWMNFQQVKSGIADVFIFVGVWTDKILFWVLTDDEVKNHPLISHQHRGGIEYQIGITDKNIKEFEKFLVKPNDLIKIIKKKIKK